MKQFALFTALILLTFVLIPSSAGAAGEEKAARELSNTELVAALVKAYGGRQNLEKLTAVHAVGSIDAAMLQDSGSYERFFRRDRRLKTITAYSRSSETRILNNSRGYRGTHRSPVAEVKDHRLLAMVYQFKYLDMPYGLSNEAYAITNRRAEELRGKQCEVLRLIDLEGPVMDIFIDPDTFLILKVTGFFSIGSGAADLSAEFFDFRSVGITVMPFKIVNYGSGMKIGETVMKAYELPETLPDSLFEP